jgi:ribosomal protein S10
VKYVATGCFMALSGWVVLALAIALGLRAQAVPWAESMGIATLAGLPGWIAVGLLNSWFQLRRQRLAISGHATDMQPKDGAQAVLVGTLAPMAPIGLQLLTAPLTGEPCLAYSYQVTEICGTGKHRKTVTHAKGYAQLPATITTRTGSYKLLAVPELQGESDSESRSHKNLLDITASDARVIPALMGNKLSQVAPRIRAEHDVHTTQIAAFRAYAQETSFTSADKAAKELTERWADADGQYRSDVAYSPLDSTNLLNCLFKQQVVKAGAPVCVFGTYSADKGGIVPSSAWRGSPRLLQGPVDQVAAKLRGTGRWHLILGLLFAAGCAALVFAAIPPALE